MRRGYYNEYVPVAVRRERARKKMLKLMDEGEDIQPIEPFTTRTIATSFWGKSWCRHLEQFSDYANRLPRGRTYVRNGSVCHLGIDEKCADAMVSGSELYKLSIHIDPLDHEKWASIKMKCKGKIGSLIELLQGKISDEVMELVTDPMNGLFPHPKEIRFNCNCPDWADMCKHVAAVMYGIGVRLDTQPELLFKLRGVNHEELIAVDTAVADLTSGKRSRRRRTLSDDSLDQVFGIELEADEGAKRIEEKSPSDVELTGQLVTSLREKLDMSRAAFARHVGVSSSTIKNWEQTVGVLSLHPQSRAMLMKVILRG